jgi:hypothetical protein
LTHSATAIVQQDAHFDKRSGLELVDTKVLLEPWRERTTTRGDGPVKLADATLTSSRTPLAQYAALIEAVSSVDPALLYDARSTETCEISYHQ